MSSSIEDDPQAGRPTPKRPKNITKDKRAWWLSHEAFLNFQALAEQQGLSIPQFLETLSRQLARERLSQEERTRIKEEAKHIAALREQTASEAGE
jgi:hypothetical protein